MLSESFAPLQQIMPKETSTTLIFAGQINSIMGEIEISSKSSKSRRQQKNDKARKTSHDLRSLAGCFAAIDFETANECPSSVCSVGVVVVKNGQIVDRFYSLINPEPCYYKWFCSNVHGITEEDTADAPVFSKVWKQIAPKIEGLPLVAHNACFDEGCLKAVFQVYQMDYPDYEFYDTLAASRAHFGRTLENPSAAYRRCCLWLQPHQSP